MLNGREACAKVHRVEGNLGTSVARPPRLLCLVIAALAFAVATGAALAADPEFPRPAGYVNDYAAVLDVSVRNRLEALLTAVDERFGVQVAIVSLKDTGDYDPTDYANRLFEAWGIGGAKSDRGLLFLDVAGGPGRSFVRVEVGYGLEGVLPDGRIGRILDQDVVPLLRDGDRNRAYAAAVRSLLAPVLQEAGNDPAQLDSLLAEGGWQRARRQPADDASRLAPLLIFIALIVLMSLLNRGGRGRRRYRRDPWIGGGGFGGFGGFGGWGGGGGGGFGGGGFGGFGGGSSGGGGAGRGY